MNRFAFQHVRLWVSALLGVTAYFLLPEELPAVSRLLVSWDTFTVLFMALVSIWMVRRTAAQIRAHYAEEDATAPVILLLVTVASLLSLLAIVVQLKTAQHASDSQRAWHIALAAVTVASSWLMVAFMFTLHYADYFYSADAGHRPLDFPKTAQPVFTDFAYFSFTIAAACQTSDVSTSHGGIRRVVLIQTLVSFVFNLAILGFAINVSAGLLNGH